MTCKLTVPYRHCPKLCDKLQGLSGSFPFLNVQPLHTKKKKKDQPHAHNFINSNLYYQPNSHIHIIRFHTCKIILSLILILYMYRLILIPLV